MTQSIDIYPSLLSADFAHMAEAVKHWDALDIQGFHLDVMDGHFVPNLTFGAGLIAALRPYTQKTFDVHLMIEDPLLFLEPFVQAGADRLSFHVELPGDPLRILKSIKEKGCQAGLAINPKTPARALFPYLHQVDFVLLMTVEPGFAGGSFVPEALEKIPDLLSRRADLKVCVDGAMGPETVGLAASKGARQIVSGSKLFVGGAGAYQKNLAALRNSLSF